MKSLTSLQAAVRSQIERIRLKISIYSANGVVSAEVVKHLEDVIKEAENLLETGGTKQLSEILNKMRDG